jgi:hypothetical protein
VSLTAEEIVYGRIRYAHRSLVAPSGQEPFAELDLPVGVSTAVAMAG